MDSKFKIDDKVFVKGYEGTYFRVMEVKWTNKYEFGIEYNGYIYRLIDTKTYEIMDAFENEMKLAFRYSKKESPKVKKIPEHILKWNTYEDYMLLYDNFGDDTYFDAARKLYEEMIEDRDKNRRD